MNIIKLFILRYGLGKNYQYCKLYSMNILYAKMYLSKGIKFQNNDTSSITIILIPSGHNAFGNWLKWPEPIGDE